MTKIAFFSQDLIGDALVWANMPKAAKEFFAPCEVSIFCTKSVADLFRCMAFCDRVVSYDPTMPWTAEEARGFGRFDAVVNTRYDADSVARVEALDHDAAYGFENIDIPEVPPEMKLPGSGHSRLPAADLSQRDLWPGGIPLEAEIDPAVTGF